MMTQLEFCSEHNATAIARAQASEPATIPTVGDRAHVPREKDNPIYLQVAGRDFYYDEHGALSTVRLSCVLLPDDENEAPRERPLALDSSIAIRHHYPADAAPILNVPFSCPRCACLMTLHQPDPELTDRLLAVCEYCKSWYLTNPTETMLRFIRQPRNRPSRQ
jgi:hypothetical protein